MHIIKLKSVEAASEALAKTLKTYLDCDQQVLWLLSGGSAIKIAVEALARLSSANLKRLTIAQIDERFGTVGHEDSNWQALINAGLDSSQVDCIPILTGITIDQTVENYTHELQQAIAQANFKIGLFGIGLDGHTAGILPHSPAGSSPELVAHFQWSDFYRITITPQAIRQLDQAIAYVEGQGKQPVVARLKQDLDPRDQPAQFLKQAKQLIVYNVA